MARRTEALEAQLNRDMSLVRLAEAAGISLEQQGAERVGQCPFHDGGGLAIHPKDNTWTCPVCGSGDAVGWVAKLEGVSRSHAVRLLDEGYEPSGVGRVEVSTTPKLEPFAKDVEAATLMQQVCDYYQSVLTKSPDALTYLQARGLNHPDLIERFSLGYADRTLGYRLPAKNRQAGAEIRGKLQELGLYRASGHEHFSGSLVIPIKSRTGRIVQVYGRKIRDNLRKGTPYHLTTPDTGEGVWNLPAFEASDELILAKNLIDGLTFWSAGYRNVTACVQQERLEPHMLQAFADHGIKRVLIAFDRTHEGDRFAQNVAADLAGAGIEAFRILFAAGHDANSFALSVAKPADRFGDLIRAAEWLGAGKAPKLETLEPVIELLDPNAEDEADELAELEGVERSEPPEPEPYQIHVASPVPQQQKVETVAEQDDHEVRFTFEDRRWRVRGLARNTSYETLRINLLVSRTVMGADAFHVDHLDLYAAKPRASFVKQAALETGCSADTIKADMGRILLELEGMQDEKIKGALEPAEIVPDMEEDERADAMTLLQSENLLDQIVVDAHACGIVGEDANLLAAYLAAISRKLDKPLAVLIQSTSAAGKSALMDAVLAFVPDEDRIAYSAMTGQALYYLGAKNLKHKVLAIAEEEGARDAAYALKLLQSQGSLAIASTGKDPMTGKLVTQDYAVEGPVSLMMTTTAIDLDEELKNRCLVLTVDENRDQTRAIHDRQRFEETLAGLEATAGSQVILTRHRNAQRLLEPLHVVNPYADQLTFLDHTTRTRRDHGKYLCLIRAVALLHQHQRATKTFRRSDGEKIEYVEVIEADIVAVNKLFHSILGRTLDDLPPQTRRLLDLLLSWVRMQAEDRGVDPREIGFTRRDVREETGWGHTQLKIHLRRLLDLEYVWVKRSGPAGAHVYELVYDGEDQSGAYVMGLTDTKTLDPHAYGSDWSGVKADRSVPGRGMVGGRSGVGRTSGPATVAAGGVENAPEPKDLHKSATCTEAS